MATHTYPTTDRAALLRRALQADGLFALLGGLLLIVDAGPIAAWIGLSAPLVLVDIGIACIGYAALLFLAARRTPIHRGHALAFVIADVVWIAASAALLLGSWAPLTTAGVWAVLAVADIVAVFAALQYVGWRRLA